MKNIGSRDGKKRGVDAHWAEKFPVVIDKYVAEKYWTKIRGIVMNE